jgi:NitT/TauT family transport system permease protein
MTAVGDDAASRAMEAGMNPPVDRPTPRRRRFSAMRGTALVLLCQILVLIVFLAAWEYATTASALNAFLFGSPSAIFGFLVQMWQDGSLLIDTRTTAVETLLGFAIGNLLGTVIGLTLWYSRFVSRVVQPFIIALGSIPIIALAPICIIWFGTGLASKVAMATLSVVVVALITAYKGAMTVDIDQINMMRTLGASKRHIFAKLIVPASLGDIFAGLKLTVGFALIGAIVGEFMSSSEGLGHAIFRAGSLYIIPKVFAALVVTIALALCLTYAVGKIEKLLTPWRQTA